MRSFSLLFKQFSRSVLVVAGFAFFASHAYAQGDATKGEAIFKANCTTCHAIDRRVIGPPLGTTITQEKDDKWLYKWIENNQALIAAKDPKALAIYNQYQQAGMTVFGSLTDGDVANILTYVRTEYAKELAATPPPSAAAADTGPSDLVIFALIGVIVLAFAKNKKLVFFVLLCGTAAWEAGHGLPFGIPTFTRVTSRYSLSISRMICMPV
jgi:mono/diheme cytochrome c family protein